VDATVVSEVRIELTMLSVLTVEVCTDVVGLCTVDVMVEVSDSTDDVTIIVVELGNSCEVSTEVGFDSEVIVEVGETYSVGIVEGALSVSL
jgi:hypothetical protein